MLFTLIIIVLVAAIAYFHYIQGFFSATLSAICAIFAAVLAFGYHETVVSMLLAGRVADYAHGMVLVALFAALYTILRLVFDSFVPGNVQVPLFVDKIGAGAMGVVAGLFCTGILAVAAQLLPFRPPIGGYARQTVDTSRQVQVSIPGMSQAQDIYVHDELTDEAIDPSKEAGMFLPVDDLLVGMVGKLSDGGSLAGAQPLKSVHPNFLLEAFGQRLGVQAGARRVLYNTPATEMVSLGGLYRLREAPQVQGELTQIKDHGVNGKTIKSTGDNELLLVVRTKIDTGNAGDPRDRKVRFSLGSVRLFAIDANGQPKNHWPIGTVEDGVLIVSRPDDFLAMPANKSMVDLVFRIASTDILEDVNALRGGQAQIAPGAFLEFKRMARVNLGGEKLNNAPPPRSPDVGLQWKQPTVAEIAKVRGVGGPVAGDGPIELRGTPRVSDQVFTPINVGTGDRDNNAVQFGGGTASLANRQFKAFNVDGSLAIARLAAGEYTVQQLVTPAGKKLVQITAAPKGGDPWTWGDVSKFELDDATGGKHKPVGAWAKVVVGTAQHFLGAYDVEKGVGDVPQIDGRPTEITLVFAVPPGVTLTTLKFDGKPAAGLNFEVK